MDGAQAAGAARTALGRGLRFLLGIGFGERLPLLAGELSLQGPSAPVTIRRDNFGIPHIEAQSDDDAWFGLGFCQGQDRAFQLELRLRLVRGTLSEVFGPQTIAVDRLVRRIGFREASERQLAVLDSDVRSQIVAFVNGLNSGYQDGMKRRPHEFLMLRREPTRWEPADVLGAGKLMSFLLIGNWDVELARLQILRLDGVEALRDLDPAYVEPEAAALSATGIAGAIERLEEDIAGFLALARAGGASNNWALAGSRTASGRPILANDPHLDPSLPAHWYLAHMQTPGWSAAGATLVGAPAIGLGHNGFAAWGITAGLVDTVDLFVEDVGPDGRSVRQGEEFVPCEARREVIAVKGRPPVTEDVLVTPRGPIVGPALEGGLGALSLRAVWLDAKPARGFLTIHRARSFEEFRREFRAWPLLNQNVVYADAGGNIAWQLVGEAPRRRTGWGTLPFPGWLPEAGWQEEGVPFEEMPFCLNPTAGYVASANSRPEVDGEMPYLGVDFLDGYRRQRIVEAISGREDWDVAATMRLQLDELTLAWREIRDAVLEARPVDGDAAVALALLRSWDGRVTADSPAATIFELFVAEMWRRVARARAPRSAEYALGRGFTPLLSSTTFASGRSSRLLRHLREQPAGWFERPWPEEMAEALARVARDLAARFGADPAGWAWAAVRPVVLEHPLGRIKFLAPIFNRGPYPFGGDGNTLSQAGGSPLRPLGRPGVIASVRMVIEVGEWDATRFSLPGGQSGNPFSRHYDDLLPLWLRGDGVPIAWSPEAVVKATETTLRLLPAHD
jgi:penicillin G amidase